MKYHQEYGNLILIMSLYLLTRELLVNINNGFPLWEKKVQLTFLNYKKEIINAVTALLILLAMSSWHQKHMRPW